MKFKLKELLKKEWIKTLIMIAVIFVAFFAFWYGIKFALATEYPLLAVASDSMVPTLNVGDLIIVHGISNASEIYAHPVNGDIIVFHTYVSGGPNLRGGLADELIVHRAIGRNFTKDYYSGKDIWFFTTKGDNNKNVADPWKVPEYYVVGKVVGVVPWIGHIPLEIRKPTGLIMIIVLIVIVIFVDFLFSYVKEKQKPPVQEEDQTKTG